MLRTPYSLSFTADRVIADDELLTLKFSVHFAEMVNMPTFEQRTPISKPRANPSVSKDEVKKLIAEKAREQGVEVLLALKVAECESGLNLYARNKSSSAKSAYQIIDGTWKSAMKKMGLPPDTPRFQPEIEIEAGIFLIKESLNHFSASRGCWSLWYLGLSFIETTYPQLPLA